MTDLCIWCNECPTIPYDCTCDAKDEPHDITCERCPNFSGERVWDEKREALYNLGSQPFKLISEIDDKKAADTIRSALIRLSDQPVLDRFKILKCEQDAVDPTKFTVEFEWMPE